MVAPPLRGTPSYTIYCDGACIRNPGGRGGWGFVLLDRHREIVREANGHIPAPTTSNRAEILAAARGLEAVPEGATVRVWSDSQYVIFTMSRNWRTKKNKDLWRQLKTLCKTRRVEWAWLRGHAGNLWNERSDTLAGMGCDAKADDTALSGRRKAAA